MVKVNFTKVKARKYENLINEYSVQPRGPETEAMGMYLVQAQEILGEQP